MASSFAAGMRLTIKKSSTYRKCVGCKKLTALPGSETRCTSCRPPATRQRCHAA